MSGPKVGTSTFGALPSAVVSVSFFGFGQSMYSSKKSFSYGHMSLRM